MTTPVVTVVYIADLRALKAQSDALAAAVAKLMLAIPASASPPKPLHSLKFNNPANSGYVALTY